MTFLTWKFGNDLVDFQQNSTVGMFSTNLGIYSSAFFFEEWPFFRIFFFETLLMEEIRNSHLGCLKPMVNTEIKCQTQLVSRICSMNSIYQGEVANLTNCSQYISHDDLSKSPENTDGCEVPKTHDFALASPTSILEDIS